ncbi:Stf0 family sulfotransferase [Marinobacter sp. F4216]|uniref:Stf0 family sulfotransferase n=1 Tax=Marinobacter sp. F4216 TaxID=2874281 RepID=UPI001CC08926|nr:Stf0 family sulfotransferase [Marinobacter sp. F4216]MBZ2169156.1 hypothetical protein [Marinobacter sp. F4216]
MAKNDVIRITREATKSAIAQIPESDFIDKQYDVEHAQDIKGVFLLLSTPRSGSTMICDLLFQSGFCLAHEYFQPYNYLPIIAKRWKCLRKGILDKEKFINQLIRFRTMESGWLGINLHGRHLPLYWKLEEYFPQSEKVVVRVRRKDVVAQAVSYEIATQTGGWSSEFQARAEPVYSFKSIKYRINSIKQQDIFSDIFVSSINVPVIEVVYEELVKSPREVLSFFLPKEYLDNVELKPSLEKQASSLNRKWIDRFTQEYIETDGKGHSLRKRDVLKRMRKKEAFNESNRA